MSAPAPRPVALLWVSFLALVVASGLVVQAYFVDTYAEPGYVSDGLDLIGYVVFAMASVTWLLPSFLLAAAGTAAAAPTARRLAGAATVYTAIVGVAGGACALTLTIPRIGTHSVVAEAMVVLAVVIALTPLGVSLVARGRASRQSASPRSMA